MSLPDWDRRLLRVDGKTGVRLMPLGSAALKSVERYVRCWGITEGPPLEMAFSYTVIPAARSAHRAGNRA